MKQLLTNKNSHEVLSQITNIFNKHNPRRWHTVTRVTDTFEKQQFNLLFFRDMEDIFTGDKPENDRIYTLIPLYQYLGYLNVNGEHTNALLEGFLYDNCSYVLDIEYSTIPMSSIMDYRPEKVQFITNELCLTSFIDSDVVPIYMVNKDAMPLGVEPLSDAVKCDYYVKLQHTIFIDLVFRSYSVFVSSKEFAKDGFTEVWQNYLILMQENALSNNLDEIHRAYWLTQCPELANINQTINSIN